MNEKVIQEIGITSTTTTMEPRSRRRSFTGSISLESNSGNVRSRYLRASIGSCHDLCKHGRRLSFEDDLFPLSPIGNNVKLTGKRSPVGSLMKEDKKIPVDKYIISLTMRSGNLDSPKDGKNNKQSPKIVKQINSSSESIPILTRQKSIPLKTAGVHDKPTVSFKAKYKTMQHSGSYARQTRGRPEKIVLRESCNDEVIEKTLYVIDSPIGVLHAKLLQKVDKNPDAETHKMYPSLPVDKEVDIVFKSECGETRVSEHDDEETKSQSETLKGVHMLKFRKGNLIKHEAENITGRLAFRKRDDTTLNSDDDVDVPGLKSTNMNLDGVTQDSTDSEIQSFALRHQDFEMKNAQGLYNIMIEETANKLVETRKSKVKALVGAFETVISLQENKPMATI